MAMDYELESRLRAIVQSAAGVIMPPIHDLAQLAIFRECWAAADEATRAEFAKIILDDTAKAIVAGKIDHELANLVAKKVAPGVLDTESSRSALDQAIVARALKVVEDSSDYYRGTDLLKAISAVAKEAVDRVAAENAPAIEAKLRDAVTNAMLDDAVRVAANAMSHELRRKVEEAAAAKALTAGEAT
jgi:hypothetical protein